MHKSDPPNENISGSKKIIPSTFERNQRHPTVKLYESKNVTIAIKTQPKCLGVLERKEVN